MDEDGALRITRCFYWNQNILETQVSAFNRVQTYIGRLTADFELYPEFNDFRTILNSNWIYLEEDSFLLANSENVNYDPYLKKDPTRGKVSCKNYWCNYHVKPLTRSDVIEMREKKLKAQTDFDIDGDTLNQMNLTDLPQIFEE